MHERKPTQTRGRALLSPETWNQIDRLADDAEAEEGERPSWHEVIERAVAAATGEEPPGAPAPAPKKKAARKKTTKK